MSSYQTDLLFTMTLLINNRSKAGVQSDPRSAKARPEARAARLGARATYSIRSVLAIANQFDLDIHQIDVKTAFLMAALIMRYTYVNQKVMKTRIIQTKSSKLRKSIYGLKKSARCRNRILDRYLKESGYL